MAQAPSKIAAPPIDLNSRRTLAAILYLSVIGPCVFILQPGFVQGLVEQLGMTEQQAGYVASAEMWGIAVTTLALIFAAHHYSWRRLIGAFAVLSGVGNLLCIGQSDLQVLMLLRFIVGIGSGGIISLTFSLAGLTANPDRNFGYIIVWVLTYGALGLVVMPTAYAHIGMAGVLVFFGLFCLSGLWFVGALPHSGLEHADTSGHYEYAKWLSHATLIAILIYNVAVGIIWAYLFLVGTNAGMPEQQVANVLMVSQIAGIAGAFVVVVFEKRFGRLLPLAVGVLGSAASAYLLVGQIGAREYWLGVCGFNLLWNLSMPYMLATAGDFDAKKHTVVFAIAMQMLGLAVGPMIAARLLGEANYDAVNRTAAIVFVLSAFVMLPGVLAQRRAHGHSQ
ncbi:MAG: MFS transporter [Steroidobacteraceae bacterium]